jgi:hypothetical protein
MTAGSFHLSLTSGQKNDGIRSRKYTGSCRYKLISNKLKGGNMKYKINALHEIRCIIRSAGLEYRGISRFGKQILFWYHDPVTGSTNGVPQGSIDCAGDLIGLINLSRERFNKPGIPVLITEFNTNPVVLNKTQINNFKRSYNMRHPTERTKWGINLKKYLESKGQKLTWLAKETGIPYWRLKNIVSGADPDISEAAAISEVLAVDLPKFYNADYA